MDARLTQSAVDTRVIHGDRPLNATSAVVPPIYQTANFRATSTDDFTHRASASRHPEYYTRLGNPTLAQAERILADLEGAEAAMLTGSGMGAMSVAVLGLVGHGDHVVAQTHHYGGTESLLGKLLPRYGVAVTRVDQRDTSAFDRAVRPNTKLFVVESPTNPVMHLTDLAAVASLARAHGITTIADGTIATPLNQRPLDLGIDIVVHSATKYFGGHSDLLAGAVIGASDRITAIWDTHVVMGAALAPFDAWLLLRGLRTLPLRLRQHNASAMKLAEFLAGHPAVEAVNYPGLPSHPQHALACRQMRGFGGVLSFEVRGGFDAANRCLSRLHLFIRAASLGGVESLAVHPASNFARYMTTDEAARAGIMPGLLRISVGLEGCDDLIADLAQALA